MHCRGLTSQLSGRNHERMLSTMPQASKELAWRLSNQNTSHFVADRLAVSVLRRVKRSSQQGVFVVDFFFVSTYGTKIKQPSLPTREIKVLVFRPCVRSRGRVLRWENSTLWPLSRHVLSGHTDSYPEYLTVGRQDKTLTCL